MMIEGFPEPWKVADHVHPVLVPAIARHWSDHWQTIAQEHGDERWPIVDRVTGYDVWHYPESALPVFLAWLRGRAPHTQQSKGPMHLSTGECIRCSSEVTSGEVTCECGWLGWPDGIYIGRNNKPYAYTSYHPKHGWDGLAPYLCEECEIPTDLEVEYNALCDYCQHVTNKDD